MQTIRHRVDKNKLLLYSTWNSIQRPMINYNGKKYKKNVHMCNYVILLCSRNEHNTVNQLSLNKLSLKIGIWEFPLWLSG